MQTTKLERISVKGDRRKAETVKVCRRERQVVKLCVVSSAGLLVGDDAWGSPRARHEILSGLDRYGSSRDFQNFSIKQASCFESLLFSRRVHLSRQRAPKS